MSVDPVAKTAKRGGGKRGPNVLVLTEVNKICYILLVFKMRRMAMTPGIRC